VVVRVLEHVFAPNADLLLAGNGLEELADVAVQCIPAPLGVEVPGAVGHLVFAQGGSWKCGEMKQPV
jgi:hypothetical protein